MADNPSLLGLAPVPPLTTAVTANSELLFAHLSVFPRNVMFHKQEAPSAGTLSGIAFSKQPKTTSGSICPIICLAHTAAGYGAFKIEPNGASISKGFREPALLGISALTRQLKPKQV